MKRTRIQYFTMMLGCLLAMVIVCSHVLAHQITEKSKAQIEATGDATGHAEETISIPSFSLPTPVHVEISLDFHCLFEIAFGNERKPDATNDSPISQHKLLSTLFRVIIAPNAP